MPRGGEGQVSQQPFLAAGAGNEARAFQFAGGAQERPEVEVRFTNSSGSAVVQYLTPSDAALLESARTRLMYLALGLGALSIVHQVAMYITGLVEISQAVEELRRDMPSDLKRHMELPGADSMVISGIPRLLGSILFGLSVPFCGYYGVKMSDARLLGCFSCCNGCCGFGALLTLLFALGGLVAVENLEPIVEPWLSKCDPSPCLQLPSLNQTLDCLAGQPRRVAYPHAPHLSGDCPQAFLACTSSGSDGCMDPRTAREPCKDDERRSYCDQKVRERGCEFLGRCVWRDADEGERRCEPVGLPYDVVGNCKVDQTHVDAFRLVRKELPDMSFRVKMFLAVKLVLTVPAAALACLGMCWGWSLFGKMNAGYSTVGEAYMRETPQGSQEMALRPPAVQATHVQPPGV